MATWTAQQIIALEMPDLGTAVLSKNGVSIPIAQFIQNELDTANQIKELALASIFRKLASENLLNSERLGEYSYEQQKNYFLDRQFYWEGQARAMGFADAAPTVPQAIAVGWPYPATLPAGV